MASCRKYSPDVRKKKTDVAKSKEWACLCRGGRGTGGGEWSLLLMCIPGSELRLTDIYKREGARELRKPTEKKKGM